VRELGLALGRWHPELEPWFVLNRDLPVPALMTEAFMRHGRVVFSDDSDLPLDAIYHVPSPFEPSPLDRLWPPSFRGLPLVVTLHDLIPAVFPDENMPDPGVRRFYWTRAEVIRQAERVLSVSQATADDAVHLFNLRPEKLSITGGGVSESFSPPASRSAVRAALEHLRPSIDAEFLLYTGGMDYRKNVGGLLTAYARLPEGLRDRYKLVLVGQLGRDDPLGPFAAQADSLGISDRVVFTGFVSDQELALLYQGASLFVFPSLYEGFGLPVVEALACGAPAIVGRSSSLVELVDDERALFNPADPSSIEAALARALSDTELLERLRRPEIRERYTWRRIAALTAAAYEEVSPRPRPARRRRRILCVAPLPALGADGETTYRVLEAMTDRCEIDLLVDDADAHSPPPGVEPLAVAGLERVERLRGGYDATVHWLGNSIEYALPMHVLRSRPGIVVAYNVRLTELYAAAASQRPDLEPRRFIDALRSIYSENAARWLSDTDILNDVAAANLGLYMAREAIARSKRFFVHFQSAVSMARLDAAAGDLRKIDRLPLPLPQVDSTPTRGSRKPVAVFKGLGPSWKAERVVSQLRELGAQAAIASGGSAAADCSAVIALRGAPDSAGFASFVAGSLAAGLPTLLLGFTLGDHDAFENVVELDAEPTDKELRGALDREPRPVTPKDAIASVQAVADRLYDAIRELKSP
jgi:glycosyltransferase involved in cell wall biosynthesis